MAMPFRVSALVVSMSVVTGSCSRDAPVSSPPEEAAQTQPTKAPLATANPLADALRVALRRENPFIAKVEILELRKFWSPREGYIMIGRGINQEERFQGDFNEELFGIFVVDAQLLRIDRTLEIMPTPRWGDFTLWIESWDGTHVVVRGQDGFRRAYRVVPK